MSDTPRASHASGAIGRARRLRRDMTASEKRLWKALRALDLHIRRQAPIGRYVADFAHHGARLIIEVDGGWHDLPEAQLHDAERDAWLTEQGYRVMRIRSREAFDYPYDVADRVAAEIQRSPPSPALPPSRGKGDRPQQSGGQRLLDRG
jgi:very-short-patch-repair endonuclease